MDRTLIHGDDRGFLDEFLDPSTDFVKAYTSGSTGTPKEIRLAKSAMIESARATVRFFGLDAGSCLVSPLSADYIAGKMMIVRGLVAGAHTWMLPPRRTSVLDEVPESVKRIDLLPIVPAQIDSVMAWPRRDIVRNIIIGGAPLAPDREAAVAAAGLTGVWATYGMTETCSHVALRHIGGEDADVYRAMPGITFSLDGRGCLCVGNLATNDLVELIDSRSFRWLGRIDNVINSGGLKLHPELLERRLAPHLPGVEFYLTSRPSELWGREMVMVVTGSPRPGIMETCRGVLSSREMPKEIIFDTEPRYSTGGKLLRRRF